MNRPYAVLSGLEIAEAVHIGHKWRERSGGNERQPSDIELKWLEENKDRPRIHIDDFNPVPSDEGGRLNPNSYNLRLADELLTYTITPLAGSAAATNSDDVREFQMLDMKKDNPTLARKIPPEGIVLMPGILYLGRTTEYTESHNVRPCVNGRSSIGRLGIAVHVTAGYGDVGFCGTWTLEIVVVHPVRIYAGVEICQIDFAPISPNHRPYRSKKYQGQRAVTPSRLFQENKA